MKKIKIAAIAACSALALFACDQSLSIREDEQPPVTLPADGYIVHGRNAFSGASNNDGDYKFHFKNGKTIHGDCDGYDLSVGGKTVIYEYFQKGINAWEKRLKEAGIPAEIYRTSKPGKYCKATFDTDLLKGVALSSPRDLAETTFYFNGKKVSFETGGLGFTAEGAIEIVLQKGDIGVAAKDLAVATALLKCVGIDILNLMQYGKGYDSDGRLFIGAEGVFFTQSYR